MPNRKVERQTNNCGEIDVLGDIRIDVIIGELM